MTDHKEKKRDLNIDLLKILVMVMVICLHYLSHQDFLHSDVGSPMYFMAWLLYGACVVSVDVFVIITGYYACGKQFDYKHQITRLLSIVANAGICSMIVYFLCMIAFGAELTLDNFVFSCFPTITNTNWFVTAYVLLLIFSPIVDKVVLKINKEVYRRTLILMFLFICVFPSMSLQYRLMTKIEPGVIVLFVFLYMLGGYIRSYGETRLGGYLE
ncbi:MAG: acyltransferase family protein [Lachnospiraceae bacterium]|jgi:surface polysaccharide O-acyltransferase-like enzyme|nr:acyltransferase family protein [Lachnospiraceae bacterium]